MTSMMKTLGTIFTVVVISCLLDTVYMAKTAGSQKKLPFTFKLLPNVELN